MGTNGLYDIYLYNLNGNTNSRRSNRKYFRFILLKTKKKRSKLLKLKESLGMVEIGSRDS